ncbi:unnamed protein product [Larinioides sclopetarius]|uniref:Transmembrane protein 230 n=1 Tax=Larinioides sclopetarius TaxID=280406 RepID=A0AAV2BPX9_9ARAC
MTTYGYYYERPKTPKRYFNLGVFSCTLGGLVFTVGIILVVLGSSPYEPEALWISGIVLLLLGGLLFFMGIGSIGLYQSREDKRKKELQRAAARQYVASVRGGGSSLLTLVENV